MNRRFRTWTTSAVAAVISFLIFAATSVQAQVMQQVPSDALVVIKVGNLKDVSARVAKFAETVGLVAFSPEFADPLGSMQGATNIKEGLDTAGELAFVLLKGQDGQISPDESALVLVPVTDYKAFLGNFGEAQMNGAISKVKIEGEEVHVAQWGKYAAIAPTDALLQQKPAGLKLSGLAAKEAAEKDVFIYANIPALSALALPEIAKARTEVMEEIDNEIGANPEAKHFAGVAKAAVGQIMNIGEGFMRDATSAGMGIDFNDEGIAVTVTADFKSGSYAGKLVSGFKNTDQPLMGGLPTGRKYFAAGGMIIDPELSRQVIGDLLDPISKELAATDEGKAFAEAIDSLKATFAASKSMAFGYPVPVGEPGTESVIQAVSVLQGNAKVIHESQRKTMNGVAELMKIMPKEGGGDVTVKLTPAAKSVGNVKLDTFTMDMKFPENNPAAANVEQMMTFIYGPGGMNGVFGAVDEDTFVYVQSGTDKLLADVVKAAQNPKAEDPLSGQARVKSVSGQLPAKRALVEYIFVDNIITTGINYAKAQGLEVKFAIPGDLPPVGLSVATENTGVRVDTFISTELIQQVVAAGMQLFMQFQGGGAPGQPDGL